MGSKKAHVDATQTLEESTVLNHLVRRGARIATVSYRRRIPLDLVDHYGRKEIIKALGAADPHEARRLARAMAVRHPDSGSPSKKNIYSNRTFRLLRLQH